MVQGMCAGNTHDTDGNFLGDTGYTASEVTAIDCSGGDGTTAANTQNRGATATGRTIAACCEAVPQRWWLGAHGQSCSTVCAAAGLPCTDGDWGVGDRASLEAALAEAGQSSSDRASLCNENYLASNSNTAPYVTPSSECRATCPVNALTLRAI
jgi:hypothetical protein